MQSRDASCTGHRVRDVGHPDVSRAVVRIDPLGPLRRQCSAAGDGNRANGRGRVGRNDGPGVGGLELDRGA